MTLKTIHWLESMSGLCITWVMLFFRLIMQKSRKIKQHIHNAIQCFARKIKISEFSGKCRVSSTNCVCVNLHFCYYFMGKSPFWISSATQLHDMYVQTLDWYSHYIYISTFFYISCMASYIQRMLHSVWLLFSSHNIITFLLLFFCCCSIHIYHLPLQYHPSYRFSVSKITSFDVQ